MTDGPDDNLLLLVSTFDRVDDSVVPNPSRPSAPSRPSRGAPTARDSRPTRSIVLATASLTESGSLRMSSRAPRLKTRSGKPELALDLFSWDHATGGDIFIALRKIRHQLPVTENFESLDQRVVLGLGHDDRSRPAVSGDHNMFVNTFNLVEELGQMRPSLGERHHFSNAL